MNLRQTVHTGAVRLVFGSLEEVCPGVKMQPQVVGQGNPGDAKALGFLDAEGEVHVYLLDKASRAKLVEMLTGVVMP